MNARAAADAVLALIGVAAAAYGWRVGIGTVTEPRIGLMPFLVGIVLAICGVLGALPARSRGTRQKADRESAQETHARDLAIAVAAVVGLAIGSKYAGFLPATFAFLLLLYWVSGPRRPVASVVYAASVAFVAWLVFVVWFRLGFA